MEIGHSKDILTFSDLLSSCYPKYYQVFRCHRHPYLQYLPGLLRHLGLGPQFEQPPGERPRSLEVLQLEEHVAGGPQGQDLGINSIDNLKFQLNF